MTTVKEAQFEGQCTCGSVRYHLTREPMFVHCCHCTWCQRETGSAFVINALIEAEHVVLDAGEPEVVVTPSASGRGQRISRCPECRVALWSTYAGAGEALRFIRVGTLAEPGRLPPDIHIYTSTKLPWVVLPSDTPSFAEYYDLKELWPQESLARRAALRAKRRG